MPEDGGWLGTAAVAFLVVGAAYLLFDLARHLARHRAWLRGWRSRRR